MKKVDLRWIAYSSIHHHHSCCYYSRPCMLNFVVRSSLPRHSPRGFKRKKKIAKKKHSLQYQAEQEIRKRWWNRTCEHCGAHKPCSSYFSTAFTSDASQMRWYFSLNCQRAMAKWKSSVFLHSTEVRGEGQEILFDSLLRHETRKLLDQQGHSIPAFSLVAKTFSGEWWCGVFLGNWLDHIYDFPMRIRNNKVLIEVGRSRRWNSIASKEKLEWCTKRGLVKVRNFYCSSLVRI